MRKLSIELPDVITVTSRGVDVELSLKDITADIIARLVVHGATQKVSDAAASAAKIATESGGDVADITRTLMTNARDALVKGEWTQRVAGAGVDERTRVARSVVHAAVKLSWGAKSPDWAAFTALSDADQAAKLDTWYAENAATFDPAIESEMERRAAKRDAKKALAGAVSFKL